MIITHHHGKLRFDKELGGGHPVVRLPSRAKFGDPLYAVPRSAIHVTMVYHSDLSSRGQQNLHGI